MEEELRELLDILACPGCRGKLELEADKSALRCPECRLRYRIEEGIPILMVEEATPYE